jgi:uncharacterized protein YktB (UPF0637 family)
MQSMESSDGTLINSLQRIISALVGHQSLLNGINRTLKYSLNAMLSSHIDKSSKRQNCPATETQFVAGLSRRGYNISTHFDDHFSAQQVLQ